MDLVTPSNGDDVFTVLLGTGTGTFGSRTDYRTGGTPDRALVTDVDLDGWPDVITSTSNAISVSYNRGDGTFEPERAEETESMDSVVLGDFNDDGNPDIAACVPDAGNQYCAPVPVPGFSSQLFQSMVFRH